MTSVSAASLALIFGDFCPGGGGRRCNSNKMEAISWSQTASKKTGIKPLKIPNTFQFQIKNMFRHFRDIKQIIQGISQAVYLFYIIVNKVSNCK